MKKSKKKSKKREPSKKAVRDAAAAKSGAVSLDDLDERRMKKRLRSIYDLERTVENKQTAHDLAASNAKIAKAELVEAEEALAKEIRDQQEGPGPLFKAAGK